MSGSVCIQTTGRVLPWLEPKAAMVNLTNNPRAHSAPSRKPGTTVFGHGSPSLAQIFSRPMRFSLFTADYAGWLTLSCALSSARMVPAALLPEQDQAAEKSRAAEAKAISSRE